jgi:hypothetical protein
MTLYFAYGSLVNPDQLAGEVKDFERRRPPNEYLNVLKAGWEHWGLDGERMLQDVPPTV